MKFVVITNAPTLNKESQYCAYAPYVREMDVWTKYVSEFKIVSPNQYAQKLLTIPFIKQPELEVIPSIQFNTIPNFFASIFKFPIIIFKLFKVMFWADHIHLRCPGNIGLLGCLVQVFFPKKIKTAKYAGNWDPNAEQPLSYRFQKKILSSTFWTKNMTALVYGNWQNQTKNIKSFFTATFKNEDRAPINKRTYAKALHFVFVGSLVGGKRPLLAIQIVEALKNKGLFVGLDVYGDGTLKDELCQYILGHNLSDHIRLHGNQNSQTIKAALKEAHFVILASKSEGWPKALAEAMFFGVIPIATSISCVPHMLDYGKRGVLIEPHVEDAVAKIEANLQMNEKLQNMSKSASDWSQQYTLDVFENEIKKLILA